MQDELSINDNVSSEITSRLHSLRIFRNLYVKLGETATQALMRTNAVLQREVTFPARPSRFIQSLSALRRPQTMLQTKDEISYVVEQSNEVLASATTFFPVTLFPDSIILDRTKLTVTRRTFFFSSDVMSIRIEDILNVSATVGPLFGSLTIATRVMSSDDHFTIRHFTRDDVIHMKHMIQGYVIARHNNIACDHLRRDELVDLLSDLGRDTNKGHQRLRAIQAPQRLS